MKRIENIPGSLLSLVFLYGGLLVLVFGIGVQFEKFNPAWLVLLAVGFVFMILGMHLKKKEQVKVFKHWLRDKKTSYLKDLSSEGYMKDTPEILYVEAEIERRKNSMGQGLM